MRNSWTEAKSQFLLVFSIENQRYGLPLAGVQRSLRVVAMTLLPQVPTIMLGIVNLAGAVVPVIDLRRCFHYPTREVRLSDHLIVATTVERTLALLVDSIEGVLEASPESYVRADDIMPGLISVDGVVKLAEGMVLIHDLERLLSLDEKVAVDRAVDAASGKEASRARPAAPQKAESGRR